MSYQDLMSLQCVDVQKSVLVAGCMQEILPTKNLVFKQGHLYALTGPSGAGKTTLLHLLAGLDEPTSGAVILSGHGALARMSGVQKTWYRQEAVGIVFQFHYLVQELTAIENVLLPAKISRQPEHKAQEKALELLEFVGLASKKDTYPAVLCGGERQRVALARALMNSPKFILADEPTGSLDQKNAALVKSLLLEVVQKYTSCVIIATHDVALFSGNEIEQIGL